MKRILPFTRVILVVMALIVVFDGVSQTAQRSTYTVFHSIDENDSVLVAGGQIMSGESGDNIEHGYYPLNQSLLSVSVYSFNDVIIYPNPFLQNFNVNWNDLKGQVLTIEVYNISGKRIYVERTTGNKTEINLDNCESGVYFVRGYTQEGELFNTKLIKG